MEYETYKKAKEILERFDPERHKKLMVSLPRFRERSHITKFSPIFNNGPLLFAIVSMVTG